MELKILASVLYFRAKWKLGKTGVWEKLMTSLINSASHSFKESEHNLKKQFCGKF